MIVTTYNHERFIRQALDGVLSQRTSFPFDVVVIEDYSTDGTRDIVRGYGAEHPTIVRLVLNDHNRCDNEAFRRVVEDSDSEYLAVLDGDDYWTSPDKLQKQVDYLDRHPQCAVCFHDVRVVFDDDNQPSYDSNGSSQKEVSTLVDLIDGCFVQTCSTMFRRAAIDEFPTDYGRDESPDWTMLVMAARSGWVGYMNEVMGVYRQHAGGYWTALSRIEQLRRVVRFYEGLKAYLPPAHSEQIQRRLQATLDELQQVINAETRVGGH